MLLRHPIWKENNYNKVVWFFLLTTLVGLTFSARIIVSVSNIMLVAVVFIFPGQKLRIKNAFINKYFLSLLALYLLQLFGLFYTTNLPQGWKEVTEKAGIIALPFFFCANGMISFKAFRSVMIGFSVCLLLVSFYCLCVAFSQYRLTGDSSVFFYHQLVSPIGHHAVFFSFFLFYAIIYWSGETGKLVRGALVLRIFFVLFFLVFIILLSSKLVLIAVFVFFIFFTLRNRRAEMKAPLFPIVLITICIAILAISVTDNPIKSRFVELTEGNKLLFTQNKFSPDIYFNGLQFRLLTWKFTYEILHEKKAWILGVSPGDAQKDLNSKYIEKKMYLGEGVQDKGFWNFNCHNVYLQILLESGIVGLLFLILFIWFFLTCAVRKRKFNVIFFFTVMLTFGFTESVLSSQYPILLFLFFPLLSLNISKPVSGTAS